GPAWAGAGRPRGVIEVVDEGFITVEVTDTKREALIAQAANLNNNNLSEQADAKKIIDVEVKKLDAPEIKKDVKPEDIKVKPEIKKEIKPEEIKKAAPEIKKEIKPEEIKKAVPEVKEEIKPEVKNSFPNLYAYVPEISDQEALRDVEDFGAMPKSLSGAEYESIVLNIHEDGTKVPELAPEELAELEGIEQSPEPEVKNLKAENNNKEVKDIKDVKDLKAEAKKPEVKAVKAAKEDIKLEEAGAAWHEHIVKSGETLSDIALAHGGVTAQDILRANGLKDANRLSANQILLVPNDHSKVEDTYDEVKTRQMRILASREKPKPLKIAAYVISQGDSLWSISNSQGIELDTLIGSNSFKSSAKLRPGDTIRIPNQDGIFHRLEKGEKIEAVCKLYGVDLNKLKAVNPTVDIVSLKPGDEIFLPGAKLNAVKVAANKDNNNKDSKSKSSSSKIVVLKDNAATSHKAYRWPVMGRINSPFGWRQHPITKRANFHTGIDIKADRGTVIRSAGSGKVVYSGWMGGYGKVLVIEHNNGQSTLYAHCSTLLAKQGDSVSQSENIARVGTTGQSTGPHLHFEVRVSNSPVNPLKYLK
ncbi:MAG: peptidoglycan DD-metalloendopeptidase family protein, partial [Synergistaceae bacterium]|nr:peptidoglycan DD-metalloendopeptidase family protein [Synergistaceae bacterium]